jgi:hypothetical protein
MPALLCPRCKHTNPGEAVFCYFDGAELRPMHGGRATPGQLLHDFVFPSGRRCRTFDEFVQGCQYEWDDARDLLKNGTFAQFLGGIGRMDLAQTARETQTQANADIALHTFVSRLPATQVQGPRLEITPRRVALGKLRVNEKKQLQLKVQNSGKGLLRGTLTIPEGDDWLRLEDGRRQCSVMTARDQQITVEIDTEGLAGPQAYSSKLTVITNGGVVEVPIRFDLVASPFAAGPFQGIGSPREMAERMRAQPKAAVPYLENGDVQRWFEANGWTYPVTGPLAKGVAAVQQFFEGMGLSKPPAVQLSREEVSFFLTPGDLTTADVAITTTSKKWVYAHAESDVPWLKVTTPSVGGPQQATISYEVDSTLMEPGRASVGMIRVVANAGQILALRVLADVARPHEPFTRRLLRPFFAGAILALIFRLLLAGPADVYARVLAGSPSSGSLQSWTQSPTVDGTFVKHFVVVTWWVGAVAGAVLLARRGSRWSDIACGAITGAVAGVIGAATLACTLPLLDTLPRMVWKLIAAFVQQTSIRAEAVVLWTIIWIVLAVLCWTAMGAVAGFLLSCVGKPGLALLRRAAVPVTWLFGLFGMRNAEELFAFQ